jgi:hypothetical protein
VELLSERGMKRRARTARGANTRHERTRIEDERRKRPPVGSVDRSRALVNWRAARLGGDVEASVFFPEPSFSSQDGGSSNASLQGEKLLVRSVGFSRALVNWRPARLGGDVEASVFFP